MMSIPKNPGWQSTTDIYFHEGIGTYKDVPGYGDIEMSAACAGGSLFAHLPDGRRFMLRLDDALALLLNQLDAENTDESRSANASQKYITFPYTPEHETIDVPTSTSPEDLAAAVRRHERLKVIRGDGPNGEFSWSQGD